MNFPRLPQFAIIEHYPLPDELKRITTDCQKNHELAECLVIDTSARFRRELS
jgi:hypothetical protein